MREILLVIDSLGSGGAQRQMSLLALGLKRNDYKVMVFVCHAGHNHFRSPLEDNHIDILEVDTGQNKGFRFKVFWELYRLVQKRPACIISFLPSSNFYAALVSILTRRTLITSQRSSSEAKLSLTRNLAQFFSHFCSSYITCNSFAEASRIKRDYPAFAKKVETVWNGYILDKTVTPRKSYKLSRSLLVVARIAHMKNGYRLLEALLLFQERNGWLPEVRWAGRKEQDKESVKMQEEMGRFLKHHEDISQKMKWLGEVADLEQLYKEADALVHISLFEGLPNSICEAMLFGCPVIASNVCDHPILLGNGERGILCDPYTKESICTALERIYLMAEPERAKMTSSARVYAVDRLDLKNMIGRYKDLVDTTL